jgi:hypothetical protein
VAHKSAIFELGPLIGGEQFFHGGGEMEERAIFVEAVGGLDLFGGGGDGVGGALLARDRPSVPPWGVERVGWRVACESEGGEPS